MRRWMLAALVLALAAAGAACWGGAASPEELANRYEEAHQEGDLGALRRLVYWDGVDESTRTSVERQIEQVLDRDIEEVRVEEISKGFELEYAVDGVTYRPNLEPVGRLRIEFMPQDEPSQRGSMSFLVGVKDGSYLITAVAPVAQPAVAGGPG